VIQGVLVYKLFTKIKMKETYFLGNSEAYLE